MAGRLRAVRLHYGGKQAGFDAATVGALVAGQELAALSAEESLAYDFTHRLTTAHQIAPALYQ